MQWVNKKRRKISPLKMKKRMNQAYFEPAKRGEIQLSKPAPADKESGCWDNII